MCQECRSATDRVNAVIEHDPGDETQWDWLDLPDPPASWGWGRTAHLLVGSLAHSSKWRASLEPATDQPHVVQGLDRVTRALGGVTKTWRFDRMSTVCDPGSVITCPFIPGRLPDDAMAAAPMVPIGSSSAALGSHCTSFGRSSTAPDTNT